MTDLRHIWPAYDFGGIAAGAVQAGTAGEVPADQLQRKIREAIGVAAV